MENQITKENVQDLLFSTCPSFKVFIENDLDEEDRKLDYIVAGAFARFLLSQYQKNETKEFSAIAQFLEDLLTLGTQEVKELATIGYLEGVQNVWGNNLVDPQVFYEYLLPESKNNWNELNKFWQEVIKHKEK